MRREILAFAALTIPLVLTPGIATTLVLRTSLLYGVRSGVLIAVGAALASVAYGVLAGSSTALLAGSSPGALFMLQIAGGGYLLWLGARAAWSAAFRHGEATGGTERRGGIGQGFLANALNPPIALFYFLVVPRFVPIGRPVFASVMILTAVHVGLAFTWHTSCASAAGALSQVLVSASARRAIDLMTGVILIVFALRILAA